MPVRYHRAPGGEDPLVVLVDEPVVGGAHGQVRDESQVVRQPLMPRLLGYVPHLLLFLAIGLLVALFGLLLHLSINKDTKEEDHPFSTTPNSTTHLSTNASSAANHHPITVTIPIPKLNWTRLVAAGSELCLSAHIHFAFADNCREGEDQHWDFHGGRLLNQEFGWGKQWLYPMLMVQEYVVGLEGKARMSVHRKPKGSLHTNPCVWSMGERKIVCGALCLDEGDTFAGRPVKIRACWEANEWRKG